MSTEPTTKSSAASSEVELGRISGVFGVSGEVRLFLHNPEGQWPSAGRDVALVSPDGRRRSARLTVRPGAGKRILGRLTGVDDPEAAAGLKDWRILVPQEALPPIEAGEYYLWQIEGAQVELEGERVGRVVRVHATGPIEILEIDVGEAEPAFVPSIESCIEEVDVEAGVVRLRPGALET